MSASTARLANMMALLSFMYAAAAALGEAPQSHWAGAVAIGLGLLALGRIL